MKQIVADQELCAKCDEKTFCIFKNIYSGNILLSSAKEAEPKVQQTLMKLKDACLWDAIYLKEVSK